MFATQRRLHPLRREILASEWAFVSRGGSARASLLKQRRTTGKEFSPNINSLILVCLSGTPQSPPLIKPQRRSRGYRVSIDCGRGSSKRPTRTSTLEGTPTYRKDLRSGSTLLRTNISIATRLKHGGLSSTLDGEGDVIALIAGVHTLYRDKRFLESSDEEKVQRLFGQGGPCDGFGCNGSNFGRFCALNLANVAHSKGTLRVQEVSWHGRRASCRDVGGLCVSFVEAFRSVDACEWVIDGGLAEGIERLQGKQERATLEELIGRLGGRCSMDAAWWLRGATVEQRSLS